MVSLVLRACSRLHFHGPKSRKKTLSGTISKSSLLLRTMKLPEMFGSQSTMVRWDIRVSDIFH